MRRIITLIFIGLIGTAAVFPLVGCEDDTTIDEDDRAQINRIFQTGVDQKEDAFVRAETLRVIDLLGDKRLNGFAAPRLGDASPMVRVVALRILLRTGHEDARNLAMSAFNKAQNAERREILKLVLEYGSPPLQREVTARALRSDDEVLKEIAFREGQLARVDKAIAEKNAQYLERTLLPELVHYLKPSKGMLGAMALRKFIDAGQDFRIEPFLKTFNDERLSVEERVQAGRILVYARATGAQEAFVNVVKAYDASIKDESLGIPGEVTPAPLLRIALLGAVAGGNTEYVSRAKDYLKNASTAESLEVLEALAENPSEDAALALKVALQDARDDVRARAIELYQARPDASVEALTRAMRSAKYGTQRKIAVALIERRADEWVKLLDTYLMRPSELDFVLRLLRDVIVSQEETEKIVKPLVPQLKKVLEDSRPERQSLAAYLLAIAGAGAPDGNKPFDEILDPETRYAFLEYAVREAPEAHVKIFRKYFNADNYAMRLMCAAGLWRVAAGAPPAEAEPADEAETAGAEPESKG